MQPVQTQRERPTEAPGSEGTEQTAPGSEGTEQTEN